MLSTAIENTYNIDSIFGYILGHGAIPAVGASAFTSTTINLEDLNLHDAIEHDASLTREDAKSGDNHSLQPALLQAMLDDSQGDFLTTESIARTRARREKDSLLKGSLKLGFKPYTLAYGEAALLLQALGKNENGTDWKVKKADAKVWFGEEKLPEGYVKPAKAITLSDSGTLSNAIGSMAQKIVAASVKRRVTKKAKKVVGFTA
jgi:hypothetical protein